MMKNLLSILLIILLILFSINTSKGQGLLITFEKVIKTDQFLDSTVIYSENEFSNISPYTFIDIDKINGSLYISYSKPEVNYDSTGIGIKSISGSMEAFQITDEISLEKVKNVFIKGYLDHIYIPLTNIDTKQKAVIAFIWNIKGLHDYAYPYLVFVQPLNNRNISKIYKILSIKQSKKS